MGKFDTGMGEIGAYNREFTAGEAKNLKIVVND